MGGSWIVHNDWSELNDIDGFPVPTQPVTQFTDLAPAHQASLNPVRVTTMNLTFVVVEGVNAIKTVVTKQEKARAGVTTMFARVGVIAPRLPLVVESVSMSKYKSL